MPVAQLIADNTDADVALFTERQTALDAARDEHIAAAKSQARTGARCVCSDRSSGNGQTPRTQVDVWIEYKTYLDCCL